MDKKKEERLIRAVKDLSKLPGNKRCADCTEKLPQYVNLTFSTFICTACSGIHREFSHRVKSISLSTFTLEEVKALKDGGNEACAKLYLARWDPRDYAEPEAGQEQRVRDWIRAKYIEKRWHVDSNYVPGGRARTGSRDSDAFGHGRRGSGGVSGSGSGAYDPHPHPMGLGPRRHSGSAGSSSRSLGGGVPQSQPLSAVLPDVKQVEVQRPGSAGAAAAPKRQPVDLLDLAFGPSSPERPAAPPQQQQQQFPADPFASGPTQPQQPPLQVQQPPPPQAAWGVAPPPLPPPQASFAPGVQGDPFAAPQFPAQPTFQQQQAYPPHHHQQQQPPPQQQQPGGAFSAGGGAWPQQPQQPPQQPLYYTSATPGYPPQQPLPQPQQAYALPPGAVRPLGPPPGSSLPAPRPPTLSIDEAFSNLHIESGADASSSSSAKGAAAGVPAAAGPTGSGVGSGGVNGGGGLPSFVAGEEVLYTDSQGNRFKTVVVRVHTDDHPPYYTIKLASGQERQTDFHHIAKLAPHPQPQPPQPQAMAPQQQGWPGAGGGAPGQFASPPQAPYMGPGGGGVSPSPLPPQQQQLWQQQQQPGYGGMAPPQPSQANQPSQVNPFLAPAAPQAAAPAAAPVSGNPFDMF